MYSVQRGGTRYADAPTRVSVQFYSPLLSIPVQFSTIRCTKLEMILVEKIKSIALKSWKSD